MRKFIKGAMILLVCLIANPLFGGDCSQVSNQIAPNKNNPKELRKLLVISPQCGEVYEALGDYFYEKKVWNEAYSNYEEAKKYSPDKTKLSSRLQELRPKVTALIENEQELLAYRRSIGGTTPSLPTASGPKTKLADKTTPSGQQLSTQARTKADKVGLVILFDFNSAEITPESKKLLAGFAQVLNTEFAGRNFLINGHSDNIGSREYNLQLSEERARSVKSYLSLNGVDSSRLEVHGYGFDKPIFDNDTESGRSKNRRVEFQEK